MTLLLALAVIPATYRFEPTTRVEYQVQVSYDGFLPLLGGNEGKAVVDLRVRVDGLERKTWQRAACELIEFKMTFNDAKIPLTIDDAKPYFPRTTVSLDELGTVKESDAPDIQVPVRLPGLDVKRFPDVTFVPLTLPQGGLTVGQSWKFAKNFSGSPMEYDCSVTRIEGTLAHISVRFRQSWKSLENEALEEVASETEAVSRTSTVTSGQGTSVFDTGRGLVRSLRLGSKSVTTVTDIKSGKSSQRSLSSSLSSNLGVAPSQPKAPAPRGGLWGVVDRAAQVGQGMWQVGADLVAALRFLWVYGIRMVPGLGGMFPQIPWPGGR